MSREDAFEAFEQTYKATRLGGGTQTEARAAALDALLAPREQDCKTCGGTAKANDLPGFDYGGPMPSCPDCVGGKVSLPPYAVLYDEMKQAGWYRVFDVEAQFRPHYPAIRKGPPEGGLWEPVYTLSPHPEQEGQR